MSDYTHSASYKMYPRLHNPGLYKKEFHFLFNKKCRWAKWI